MRKILVLLLVLFSVATFGQGEVLKQGQKVLKRSGKILKSHYPWEYTEPSDWCNIHYCPKDEILLVVSDEGDRYVCYQALCNSNAQYKVDIYGGIKGDSLIYTNTYNYGVKFEYQIPLGYGKPCTLGYTTYIIRFYTVTANKITSFYPLKHTNSSKTNESVLLANANSSTITRFEISTASNGGITLTRFKYCNIFLCPNLTTLSYSFKACGAMEYLTLSKTLDNLTNIEGMCVDNLMLKKCILPKYLDNVTEARAVFRDCPNLEYVEMPISMNKVTRLGGGLNGSIFRGDVKLKKVQYPLNLPALTTIDNCNYNCSLVTYYRLPTYMPNVTSLAVCFTNNLELTYLELPRVMNKVTSCDQMVQNDTNLQSLFLPDSMILCTNLNNNYPLPNLDTISSCIWGTGQVLVYFTIRDLKTFKQPTLRVSKFTLRGKTLATASQLHTINIDWANSTFLGTSPQIDIRWNSLSATTLDAIFTALPVVVGKTINVAGNPGSATCTPSIASLKGWTVIIL